MSRADAPTQASRWEWMTAVLGVALLGLLFAPWFTVGGGAHFNRSVTETVSSWDGSTATSVVVAAFGAAAIAQALILSSTRSSGVALAWNVAMNWAAIVVVVWILVRLLWPPDLLEAAWAGWTSLAVVLAMLATGWRGMADERDDRAAAPDAPLRPIPPTSS